MVTVKFEKEVAVKMQKSELDSEEKNKGTLEIVKIKNRKKNRGSKEDKQVQCYWLSILMNVDLLILIKINYNFI